jgi:hypothetical protein
MARPGHHTRETVRMLTNLPNVGPAVAGDLVRLA